MTMPATVRLVVVAVARGPEKLRSDKNKREKLESSILK